MAESRPAAYASAVAPLVGAVTERVRPNAKLIGLLALGHLVVDVNQGGLPAILPVLREVHHLSYEAVGTIILMANVTSSIVQPLFGYLSDRTAQRWLLPLAVFVSGAGIALTGVAPSYAALIGLVIVMGLGIAAYHPEGYKTASGVAGDRKATALSWFSLGGNIGIALGPPVMTGLLTAIGVAGSLGLFVPTLLLAVLLLAALPLLQSSSPRHAAVVAAAATAKTMSGGMALLVVVVAIRSWTQLGFTTFVPFYYIDELKADPRLVGPLLFVFLGAGALGTVVAGPIADRVGPRPFIKWVFILAAPFGVLFLLTRGPLAFVMLGMMGAVLVSSFSVSVVLGQAYLPRHTGMASGLIVGFAIGAGGLGVWVLGLIADHYGLRSALWLSALMPLLGFVAAQLLPAPGDRVVVAPTEPS